MLLDTIGLDEITQETCIHEGVQRDLGGVLENAEEMGGKTKRQKEKAGERKMEETVNREESQWYQMLNNLVR